MIEFAIELVETSWLKKETTINSLILFILCLIYFFCESIAFSQTNSCVELLGKIENPGAKKEQAIKINNSGDNVDDVNIPPKKTMVAFASSLIEVIESNYGPLLLKKETAGLDWLNAKKIFLRDASEAKSESDLLFKVSSFLLGANFNDPHISVKLPSTLKWTLPLQVSYIEESDSYILNFIDRGEAEKNLIEGELPQINEKLVSINGHSPNSFRLGLNIFDSKGNELTSKSIFGMKLFDLSESSGLPLSQKKNNTWTFEFEQRDSQGHSSRHSVKLKYKVTGNGIVDVATLLSPSAVKEVSLSPKDEANKAAGEPSNLNSTFKTADALAMKVHYLFNAKMPWIADLPEKSPAIEGKPDSRVQGQKYALGQTKPLFKLPADFTPIELPAHFHGSFDLNKIFAGTFTKNGRRVGLLRIPTYDVANPTSSILVIDYIVRRLEMSSDYLILDQMNNPGGSVVYSDFWIQALVKNFNVRSHMQFRVKPTSHFLNQFRTLLAEFEEISKNFPETMRRPLLNQIREQFEIVHRAFIAKDHLSQPVSLLPFARILSLLARLEKYGDSLRQGDLFSNQKEHNVEGLAFYSKPIFMLINQLDFSGGDATPANLQDYRRVILVGTRTAGAGGTVEEFESRQLRTQFNFNLTTSLMYRPSVPGQPYVENHGVSPDILLPATAEDYVNGFSTYLDRLVTIVEGIL